MLSYTLIEKLRNTNVAIEDAEEAIIPQMPMNPNVLCYMIRHQYYKGHKIGEHTVTDFWVSL